jgi:hypothetical protein
MVTQSWGMLINKTSSKMQKMIEEAGYENDVIIVNNIHDAIYFMWRKDAKITKWLNDTLIPIMTEDFMPDQPIPLAANLDCGLNWKEQHEIKNNASITEIEALFSKLEEHDDAA